eukprot:jgi/Tetstr1/444217/TSEL_032110.t1
MAADPGTMARYVTWLGNMGTIKASSLQSYLSALNNFFKDHGREPMALGDLVSRVRKGLAASQVFAGGRVPAARWAISQREGQAKWTADTLTGWLQLGATTAAYVIGVTMQKIKYSGGWAMESSVVLDYIYRPNSVACPAAWYLFGWMTPWGGQPARLPRHVAT